MFCQRLQCTVVVTVPCKHKRTVYRYPIMVNATNTVARGYLVLHGSTESSRRLNRLTGAVVSVI
jgi:hypothetical protein